MSYAGDLDVVARLLAVIGIHGSAELTQHDLDIALVARSSVLELASTVQFDLTGQRGAAPGSPLPSLEAHPTATFARSLAQYPRLPGPVSPTDALAADTDSDVGRAWQRIARHGISATHHWTTGGLHTSGPVAWAGLADVAAISAVIAELDGDLAVSASRFPQREQLAQRLATGTTSGLRAAARQVCELAAAGPLPDRGPEPRPPGNRGFVTITKPGDFATAHEQLANLLLTAEHVRPETHGLLVIGHLRTCRVLLDALPAEPGELRTALQQHEQALTAITRHGVQAASISGGDPRPMRQMQIIRQAARTGSSLMGELAQDAAETARLAAAIAATTTALRESADKDVRRGTWLLPDPLAQNLRWAPAQSWHAAPPYLQELRAAAVQGEQIQTCAQSATRDGPAGDPIPAPSSARNLLLPAPFRPLIPSRLAHRPMHPQLPPTPLIHHRRR